MKILVIGGTGALGRSCTRREIKMTRSNTFEGFWAAMAAVVWRAVTMKTGAATVRTERRSTCACDGLAEFLDDRIRLVE